MLSIIALGGHSIIVYGPIQAEGRRHLPAGFGSGPLRSIRFMGLFRRAGSVAAGNGLGGGAVDLFAALGTAQVRPGRARGLGANKSRRCTNYGFIIPDSAALARELEPAGSAPPTTLIARRRHHRHRQRLGLNRTPASVKSNQIKPLEQVRAWRTSGDAINLSEAGPAPRPAARKQVAAKGTVTGPVAGLGRGNKLRNSFVGRPTKSRPAGACRRLATPPPPFGQINRGQ